MISDENKSILKRLTISILFLALLFIAILAYLSSQGQPEIEYIWRGRETIYVRWRYGKIEWIEEIDSMTPQELEKLNKSENGDTKQIIE